MLPRITTSKLPVLVKRCSRKYGGAASISEHPEGRPSRAWFNSLGSRDDYADNLLWNAASIATPNRPAANPSGQCAKEGVRGSVRPVCQLAGGWQIIHGIPPNSMSSISATKIQNSIEVCSYHLIRCRRLRDPRNSFPAPDRLRWGPSLTLCRRGWDIAVADGTEATHLHHHVFNGWSFA